ADGNIAGHNGGGIFVGQGAIFDLGSNTQTLTLQNGAFVRNNSAANDGGGIYVDQNGAVDLQNLNVLGSFLQDNTAASNGGGIYLTQSGGVFILPVLNAQSVAISG